MTDFDALDGFGLNFAAEPRRPADWLHLHPPCVCVGGGV